MQIWDAHNGKLRDCFDTIHHCAVSAVAFKNFGSRKIITCDISGSLVITDVYSDEKDRQPSEKHKLHVEGSEDYIVLAPEISEDGQWVILRPLNNVR